MNVSQAPYGTTADGKAVEQYTLADDRGLEVRIITYGGILTSVRTPDRYGGLANIALGLGDLATYETANKPYFGAIIGRYANRIDRGAFWLGDQTYQVDVNEGAHSLHGGLRGFDKQVWAAQPFADAGAVGVALSYLSPDGECGFPGNLSATVMYTLTGASELRIDYQATTDRPTVVNLTNHSYWNLRGEGAGTVDDHVLYINASRYLPVGPALIPTGEVAAVDGTPFDFRVPHTIGPGARSAHPQLPRGYDHNWVLDSPPAPTHDEAAGEALLLAARVYEPASGRTLEVWTTEPGLQFYGGNFLDGIERGPSGRAYRQGDGLALETQHFPDSPHQPHFPSTELRPGATYHSATTFRFKTDVV